MRNFALPCSIGRLMCLPLLLACAIDGSAQRAAAVTPPLTLTRVASGFTSPVYVTAAPGDPSRLFVVEKGGRIKIIQNGKVLATPFLDISAIVKSDGFEQGLLGLAFDPNYAVNRKFYVNYIDLNGNTNNSSFQVSAGNPNVANTTRTPVLSYFQPYSNHNGGWIGFGPDGYLYIASGDGGDGNDPQNNAQNLNNFLGKILRIDPNGPDAFPETDRNYGIPASNPFVGAPGADEVWAYGLRNPWRVSFDRQTGDLYIADVGQTAREEINYQPADSAGGENYGWRVWEGTLATGLGGLNGASPLVPPIHEYGHTDGNISITGGYVYRGSQIEGLDGTYIFGDYGSANVWAFRYDGENLTEFRSLTSELVPNVGALNRIASFGEGADGELYIVDIDGEIFRIGSRIFGDANNDGAVDEGDLAIWADNYLQTGRGFNLGDFNRDGIVDSADYTLWADRYMPPTPALAMFAVAAPEPTSFTLLALGLCGLTAWAWRRKVR